MSFKNLASALQVVTDKTTRCVVSFALNGKDPIVLHVLPASGPANRSLQAAEAAAQAEAVPKNLPKEIQAKLHAQRTSKLFAANVIRGWEHVYDDGKPVPFSVESCEEFLNILYDMRTDLWIEVVSYCRDLNNFRDVVVGADLPKG